MKPTLIISIILLSVLSFSCSSDDEENDNKVTHGYWSVKFTSYVYSDVEIFNNKNVFEISKYPEIENVPNKEYLESIYNHEYKEVDNMLLGNKANNHSFEVKIFYKDTDRDKVDKYLAKYFPSYLDCAFFYIEHEVSDIKWVKLF
ncbi:putative nucleic acid-binding Zn ribbon protein [Dysgonomonas sp. PFB1-18]|uniref:hypothetical protein n=1 Tax=unclassified Dysgonomonas TaxID=2630389 RepID=UPI0024740F33|nr:MULTISPECIES: hypothetical protein [unclassified Dysgonomonas]MDH6307141.1 putative nucleic acid-binding Zn ribbon protein [Dysgonomonas sp. PF1-14]MDH6337060.1 putative nucleic acid-binding Zn ribbon protein [Dysgonomonas sp. PF1-16]MDH6381046.1 putative nucleic acid-binding Zn ribbon protein [Dysgonomonas sp. PFB1-18]MDH6396375.1 putative nucleic acid-binding Zn ribbon protein [Dysgonomonas sp. PF1-23]